MSSSQRTRPQVLLTIAGFDPSSGAGVSADLKTFAAHGCFGVAAITALTVQSTRGVSGVEAVRPGLLARMLVELGEDMAPAAIKIGMLAEAGLVDVVADWLAQARRRGRRVPVVLDPVIRSSSGRSLLSDEGVEAMRERLLPMVSAVTPNWTELAVLSGREIRDQDGFAMAMAAAQELCQRFPGLAVVGTGGDQARPVDFLSRAGEPAIRFDGVRIETSSTHGTGCAFSSALACRLAEGMRIEDAVDRAKAYVAEALRQAPGLGHGHGPMALLWPLDTIA